jgi:hypothetical protein
MKYLSTILLGFILSLSTVILASCQRQNTVCPPTEDIPKPILEDLIQLPPADPSTSPVTVEIGGRNITVDRLVEGPLCNDTWRGTIYVGCDVIVGESSMDNDQNPLFLKGCDLKIESNTVVYVAAHNDAAYYKGCSCHTGEDPIP